MDSARMDFFLGYWPRKSSPLHSLSRWLGRRLRGAGSAYGDRISHAILTKRLDYLAKYANDAIALVDLDGRFIDVNDRFLTTYGYRRDEIGRLNANELRPPHMRTGLPALQEKLAAQGGLVYETEHCTKDGKTIPVEISSRLIEVEGETFIQAIIRDISERREAEARILALSRLYAAISAASQAMVRAQDVQEVFDAVCRASVEYGGFRMAWVGLVDGGRIMPRASFGAGTEYLDGIASRSIELPSACEPQAVAYREGQVHICNDFIEDPVAAPWRERAAFCGFRASIALPLRRAGAIVGTLTAYADTRNFFDDEMVVLLEDLADAISFGMDHFDRDDRRREVEEERAQLGRRMQELSQRLIAAQEDERRRLAAELHDRTSPNLAAIQVTLAGMRKSMPKEILAALGSQLDDLRALIEDTASGIRDVCANLRPALLDYAGLVPALESHIQQFSRRTGLAVRLEHGGLDKRLPADVEALLFRISQEALTNCAKHARATAVDIGLHRDTRHTVLTIADDGVGFDVSRIGTGERNPGLGLLTMRERAEFAGGQLQVESDPGRGTRISVEI